VYRELLKDINAVNERKVDTKTFERRMSNPISIIFISILWVLIVAYSAYFIPNSTMIAEKIFFAFTLIISVYAFISQILGFRGNLTAIVFNLLMKFFFISIIVNVLYLTAISVFNVLEMTGYQYFIIVLYVYLIKDIFLFPSTWFLKHGGLFKLISIISNSAILFEIGLYTMLASLTMAFVASFYNNSIWPQIYSLIGDYPTFMLIVISALFFAATELIKLAIYQHIEMATT